MDILAEDESLMVLNKTAGVVVNRAESVEEGSTVQDWLEKYRVPSTKYQVNSRHLALGTWNSVFLQRSGIAHRLDKETSGCLLVAKTPEVLAELMRQFKSREVNKTYLALVHGRLEPEQGGWRLPLGRSRFNRTEFRVDPFGKFSETEYTVKKWYPDYTLVELFPKTGRTHQLRVHCKHMKHAIVSDDKYATSKQLTTDLNWCPRLFLHAFRIEFKHPVTKLLMKVEAPLPAELGEALNAI
jgi:23S rRNA pseudouridine1911/1915/1917 synthase